MPVVFVWVLACRLPSPPADDGPLDDASDSGSNVPDSGIESCAPASLWACPDRLAQPCDAWWWVDLDEYGDELAEASAVARMLREIVDANVPAECLVSCEPKDPAWSCSAASCTVDGVTIDYRRDLLEEEWVGHKGHPTIHRLEQVEAHLSTSTRKWTRLDFASSLESSDGYELAAQAAWDGVIEPTLPADGTFVYGVETHSTDYSSSRRQVWVSAGCDIGVDDRGGLGSDHDYDIALPESSLQILPQCACYSCETAQATLDGVTYEVGEEGWRIVGLDRDGDGFSVEGGDCDDDDPALYPCEGC